MQPPGNCISRYDSQDPFIQVTHGILFHTSGMRAAVRSPTFQKKQLRAKKEVTRLAKRQVQNERTGCCGSAFQGKLRPEEQRGLCPWSGPEHGRDPGVGLQAQGTGAVFTDRGTEHGAGMEGAVTGFQERPWGSWGSDDRAARPHPEQLVAASPIRELAIHLVSSTVVRAWGSRPTSFTVRMRCWDDLRSLTASSCRMLRKLRPFTSRIWSPTCQDHHTTQSPGLSAGHRLMSGALQSPDPNFPPG